MFSIIGRPAPTPEDADIEACYDYVDEAGSLLYQVVRKHGKKFVQRRPDPAGGWIWNLKGTSPVPYRLPQVIASTFVAVVEGEKDANNLHRIGITATCNNGGAGKFSPELSELHQFRPAIIRDTVYSAPPTANGTFNRSHSPSRR